MRSNAKLRSYDIHSGFRVQRRTDNAKVQAAHDMALQNPHKEQIGYIDVGKLLKCLERKEVARNGKDIVRTHDVQYHLGFGAAFTLVAQHYGVQDKVRLLWDNKEGWQ